MTCPVERPGSVRVGGATYISHGRPAAATRMDDRDHELLTIAEAADLLRSPVATLRYWRHLGVGPCSFRVGRRVLYRRTDIDNWIAARRDATRSDIA